MAILSTTKQTARLPKFCGCYNPSTFPPPTLAPCMQHLQYFTIRQVVYMQKPQPFQLAAIYLWVQIWAVSILRIGQ